MKKLLLFPFIFGLIVCSSFRETQKWLPPFRVGITQADPALPNDKSVFFICFTENNQKPVNPKIIFSVNGTQDTIQPDATGTYSLRVAPGKYIFRFYLDPDHEEIKTDSIEIAGGFRTPLYIDFRTANSMIICDKPVIYVYPPQTDSVSIELNLKGNFLFTYPQYDHGWKFLADPDGTIHMNDREYQYLFWDGRTPLNNSDISWEEGYVVDNDTLVSFLEQKLGEMGLSPKETDDYITYWCPRMLPHGTNYIHFMFNDEYNEYAGININPVPDNMFRVFMLWTPADRQNNSGLAEQEIPKLHREGFTVVEWGGAQIPSVPVNIYTASK